MNYPVQTPKTNWGMIILLIILIPILILGTIFGYKYITKSDKIVQQQVSHQNQTQNNPTNQPPPNNNQGSQQQSAGTPLDFVKTFEGKINNKYEIVAKMTANNGQITGTYFYKSTGGNLTLNGNIDANGNVTFTESDKGKVTGIFSGRMINNDKIEGSWNKPSGNTMPFYLIESNTNYTTNQQQTQTQNKPADFRGNWAGKHSGLELDISQNGAQISGTLEYEANDGSRSGMLDFVGTISGNKANIEIIKANGRHGSNGKIGTGTLTKVDSGTIKFTSNGAGGLVTKSGEVYGPN